MSPRSMTARAMPRRSRLALLAAVPLALLLTVPLAWPLRIIHGAQPSPLSMLEARGTPWSGTLRGVRWGDAPLGDVRLQLQPLALLRGQLRMHLASSDWSATGVRGLRHGIAGASGELPLPELLPSGIASVRLQAADATALFDASRCRQASGQLRLEITPADTSLAASTLTGQPVCDGDALVVDLAASAEPSASSSARLQLEADGRYQLVLRTTTSTPAHTLALQLAGFDDTADGHLARTLEGRLGD